MNQDQFVLSAIILGVLILLPLVVLGLVWWLVPAEDPIDSFVDEPDEQPGSLGDFWDGLKPHLVELRDRLVEAAIAIALGTSVGFWVVNDPLIPSPSPELPNLTLPDFMIQQLTPPGTQLKAIQVGEIFLRYMNIALVIGIIIAMPVVVYQLVAFFSPGLLNKETHPIRVAAHRHRAVFGGCDLRVVLHGAGCAGVFVDVRQHGDDPDRAVGR